jgi:hypothetical protein
MVLGTNPQANYLLPEGEVLRYSWKVGSDDDVPTVAGPFPVATGFFTKPACVPEPALLLLLVLLLQSAESQQPSVWGHPGQQG